MVCLRLVPSDVQQVIPHQISYFLSSQVGSRHLFVYAISGPTRFTIPTACITEKRRHHLHRWTQDHYRTIMYCLKACIMVFLRIGLSIYDLLVGSALLYRDWCLNQTQAILPIHFTSNFRQVISGPVVHFRMPAIPPLPALPQPLPPNALLMSGDVDKPEAGTQPIGSSDMPTLQPSSVSFSSTDSRRTSHSASTEKSSLFDRSCCISDVNTQLTSNSGEPSSPISPKTTQPTKLPLHMADWSSAESTTGSGTSTCFLIPLEEVSKLNESSLAMQLYWSYQSVLACQESMWEELVDRMRNRPNELRELGWESDLELNELESRTKFEVLLERYKR